MNVSTLTVLPIWLSFLLFVGGSVCFACAMTLTLRRRLKIKEATESQSPELVNVAFSTVGVIYGIMLGFLIVNVWSDYRDAKQSVITEAAQIITAARDAQELPEPTRGELYGQLHHYTELVITDEWPEMGNGSVGASTKTLAAFNDLWAACLQKLSAAECARWQADLSQLSDRRVHRLMSVTGDLPAVLWFVLLCGAVIISSRCLFLFPKSVPLHLLTSVVLLGSIALGLWVIVVINNPFVGDVQVSKDPLQYALHVIDILPR